MTPERRDIIEVLTKEDERFHLTHLGFYKSIDAEADICLKNFPRKRDEGFEEWKRRVLKEYYRLKGFSLFCRDAVRDERFEKTIFAIMRSTLRKIRVSREMTDTDRYLAPTNGTISFALSQKRFTELYALNFSCLSSFSNTEELYTYCKEILERVFPVAEEEVISAMKENDPFYWEPFYRKLKPITSAFCYRMSGISSDNSIHDIWSDTCITVNRALVSGNMSHPVNAKSVISYAVGIIKNKNREFGRVRKNTPADIEAYTYRLTAEEEANFFDTPSTLPENFSSQEFKFSNHIDVDDKESVQGYFIVVLYNKEHPLHNALVDGVEDKVQRLFEHYLDGLSYEEIIVKHFGPQSAREMSKKSAQLRQEIKRLKTNLIKRFDTLLKKNR